MNWLDILITVIAILGALVGWRIGLVHAAVAIIGVFVAFPIAGHVSEPIARWLTNSVGSASIAAVAAYVIVGAVVFIAVQLVGHILTRFLKAIFLGWLNTLGGALFGALAGLLVGAVIIAVLARIAFLVPPPPLKEPSHIQTREGVKNTLVDSNFVPAYLDLYDRFPASALGVTPGEFHKALSELKRVRASEKR